MTSADPPTSPNCARNPRRVSGHAPALCLTVMTQLHFMKITSYVQRASRLDVGSKADDVPIGSHYRTRRVAASKRGREPSEQVVRHWPINGQRGVVRIDEVEMVAKTRANPGVPAPPFAMGSTPRERL